MVNDIAQLNCFIADTASLTKNGTGTLHLNASNTCGGTLTITGTFVSDSSLRFGTSSSSLTATQLAKISKPGGGAVALNASGYLIDPPLNTYAT